MSLKTEYRGYEIRYSENQDEWVCYDCGVTEPTLSKAKAKIDALHLKMRKAAATPCYEIREDGFTVGLEDATVIQYRGENWEEPWMSSKKARFRGHRVASMCQRGVSSRKSRRDCYLHTLVPQTEEARAAAAEAARLGEIAKAADKAYREAIDAIPRLDIEDIEGLVEASSAQMEEGDS